MSLPGGPHFQRIFKRCREIEQAIEDTPSTIDLRVSYEPELKLCVEIETSDHLALVEGWERGRCLDVTVMNKKTTASAILSAGQCKGDEDVDLRIEQLCQTIGIPVSFARFK